ncbi:glycosyltransferase family 4 protein [Nocardioides sp. cx-173]|uniref:glycosyltransferase family 4 protein n=1 Tax=Nocardioides sp. cx-173 TaxID=2898796 RepID=UPI001E3C7234|nr:glycosyltransferase family 4 protein [Nocardioides sp. cx-173]MCD4526284.1 glycosyltransferase family 4 protein [Nocardioides sp. cx-173]UGB40508.1 glycosyltransferase family 4 protein [Nocardioides sp. cx-173]
MRLVQLLTQSTGGPVDHAVDVAVALAGRGHESHLVGPESAGTARARAAGVTCHPLEMTTKRDLAGGARVARRLAALRPDIVHLQDRRAGWLGRLVGRGLGGAGLVYTLHGVADGLSDLVPGNALAAPRRRRDSWYYLHGERAVTRWSGARVVVPSAAVAGFAVDQVRLDPTRVDVVANGVDPLRFAPPATTTTTRPRPPTVLWLGVLAEVKRVDVLLDAAQRVPDLRVLVAGDGPLLPQVRRRVADAGLVDRVSLLGRVADPAPVLARADLFALTSAAENCPLALLQAMACGLPAVATAVGGVPEVLRDGVDGLLCEVGDVAGLAAGLSALAGDPGARARMGAAARSRVLDGYTLDHCVDGLLESYARARTCAR